MRREERKGHSKGGEGKEEEGKQRDWCINILEEYLGPVKSDKMY